MVRKQTEWPINKHVWTPVCYAMSYVKFLVACFNGINLWQRYILRADEDFVPRLILRLWRIQWQPSPTKSTSQHDITVKAKSTEGQTHGYRDDEYIYCVHKNKHPCVPVVCSQQQKQAEEVLGLCVILPVNVHVQTTLKWTLCVLFTSMQ